MRAIGRRPLGRLRPVAVDEVLALVGHPVLDGDAAAERLDPLEVPVGHRLGVVEEPVQAVERHVAVDRLEDVEEPADRLVVGGVQAERPALLGQQPHDGGQVPLPAPAAGRDGARGSPRSRPPSR